MLATALRAHALAALDEPDDSWWDSVSGVTSGRGVTTARRIYDLAWGLADWLEATLQRHDTLSILGA
ncbi:MAG: hypothetical protein KTR31_10235 [Myxococcales bacterium]|nr:hypothetical protein [Myxococcales bacterium]